MVAELLGRNPIEHDWPPFILVCKVGDVTETDADFSGQGHRFSV